MLRPYCLDLKLSALLETVASVLNSSFISAAISSLAGAALGAWAAYLMARNASLRKERIDTYRRTNSAIVVSGTIANMAMSLKNQLVKPLVTTYKEDQARAEEIRADAILSGDRVEIHIVADLQKITPLHLPMESLKNFVQSMDLIPGRAIALSAMVDQSAADLSESLVLRSSLIDEFQRMDNQSEEFSLNYFGFVQGNGNINSVYADAMEAIERYTDDLIYFSVSLTDELAEYSKALHEKYFSKAPGVNKPFTADFSAQRASGTIPPHEDYESWQKAYTKQS